MFAASNSCSNALVPRLALFACAALASGAAQAVEGLIAPGEEKFNLRLGGIVHRFDSKLALAGPQRSREFDLEDVAGAQHERTSVWAEGTWRFASRHRLGIQAFGGKRENQRAISQDIELEDRTIPVNTVLNTEVKTTFVIANYQYSFMKNEKMEIAGLLGLYTAQFRFKFGATQPLVDIDRKTTAPLPVLGASIDYHINPRWTVSGLLEGLKLKIGDVEGRVLNFTLATDYMLTRNFGLGAGYNATALKVDVHKSGFNGEVKWATDGLFVFGQARF